MGAFVVQPATSQTSDKQYFYYCYLSDERKTEKMLKMNEHVMRRMSVAYGSYSVRTGARKIFTQFHLFNEIEVRTANNCTLNTFLVRIFTFIDGHLAVVVRRIFPTYLFCI